MNGWMDGHTNGYMDRLMDKLLDRLVHRQMNGQKDGWTYGWMDKQVDRTDVFPQQPSKAPQTPTQGVHCIPTRAGWLTLSHGPLP